MSFDDQNANQVIEQHIDPRACRALWCAVLYEQWKTAFQVRFADHRVHQAQARDWFGSYDFFTVCLLAGVEPVAVLHEFRRRIAGGGCMTWCYLPASASPSVQAAADLTWVLALPSRALPPPPMSKSTTTPAAASSRGSAPDTCTPRPSGMTSRPSQASPGAGSSTPCLPDIHVSRFPRRDSAAGKPIPAISGPISNGSCASLAPTSDGASLKTSRDTSVLALRPWRAPYGDWASLLRLAYSQRKKQARRMKGSGFSSWPTAKALTGGANSQRAARGAGGPDLQEAVQNWPTAMAGTPAQNGNAAAGNNDFSRKAEELAAQMFPTPAIRDHKGANHADHMSKGTGRKHLGQLPNSVAHCFTRPDLPTWTPGRMSLPAIRRARRLFRLATSRLSPATLRRLSKRENWAKRRLNAVFVEWLMGWPEGHALCGCSATGFTLWQRHMRGALSALPTASAQWIWHPPPVRAKPVQADLFQIMEGEG